MIIEHKTQVGVVASHHPLATRIFARHGIDFCCGGGKPLEEVCRTSGIDTQTLIDELIQEIQDSPPEERSWTEVPIEELINHILVTYHEPLKVELPRIQQMMEKVHQVHHDKNPAMLDELLQVVSNIKVDIENHLPKEEQILFPGILKQMRHRLGGPITVMEAEHEELGLMLKRVRELTNDFNVPAEACNTWRALWAALEDLEKETHEHIHLENNILHKRAFSG